MGVYKHREGEWRVRVQLRPGVRLSWAMRTKTEAKAFEQTLDSLRLSKRDDLIDALARTPNLLFRLHKLAQQEAVVRIRLQDLLTPTGGHAIGEIAKEFSTYLGTPGARSRFRKPFAPSTAAAYRRHIERFMGWLEDGERTPMESITSATLSAFHAYRINREKISPIGADRSVTALQALFSWASDSSRRAGGAVPNVQPLSHTKSPKLKEEARALTSAELTAIRTHVPADVWPIFEVTLNLGLRIGECQYLRVHDVMLTERIVRIRPYPDRPLKTTHSERDVPFHESLLPVLKAALANAKGEHLWPKRWREVGSGGKSGVSRAGYHRLSKVWGKAAKAAGVAASIHTLRHTYGSRLADSGVAPRDIASLMGHQSVATTERYWKTKDEMGRKRDAVEKLGLALSAPTVPPTDPNPAPAIAQDPANLALLHIANYTENKSEKRGN
jgi:integrase